MSDSLARSGPLPASVTAPGDAVGYYLVRTALHPAGVATLVFTVCMGTWLGGSLGLLIGLMASVGLIASASRWRFFRQVIDDHLAERERRSRFLERERRMERAGPLRRAEFAELHVLVHEIEQREPAHATRFELQELLDHYVELASAHQRLVEALQRADRAPLWETGAARSVGEPSESSRHRREILARRLEHRDRCRARAARLGDELDAVAEFIHLVSEVTTCPLTDGEGQRELERRLWELDTQESALRQLSAA
jgi:hypothetical protein